MWWLALACSPDVVPGQDPAPFGFDDDRDGHLAAVVGGLDCDDSDPARHPGAPETCNGIDDDCDGKVDIGDLDTPPIDVITAYKDDDGDGFGNGLPRSYCPGQPGVAFLEYDCDDQDPQTYPGAPEICDEPDTDCDGLGGTEPGAIQTEEVCGGYDEDCDGLHDNDDPDVLARGPAQWFDKDGDGYGRAGSPPRVCALDGPHAPNDLDCDDESANIHPDTTWPLDDDGDGWGAGPQLATGCTPPPGSGPTGDCDDADASSFPGAPESCGTVDHDCDGVPGQQEPDAVDAVPAWPDADGDGVGDDDGETTSCDPAADGLLDVGGDCDSLDPAIPAAVERCTIGDEDCDGLEGLADPDLDPASPHDAWLDLDADGFGDPEHPTLTCGDDDGTASNPDDCDDGDANITDGSWFADSDVDGWGDQAVPGSGCSPPAGVALKSGDCDPADPDVFPGAEDLVTTAVDEACDGDLPPALSEPDLRLALAVDGLGERVAVAPDLDGDGRAEVLVGDAVGNLWLIPDPMAFDVVDASPWFVSAAGVLAFPDLEGDGDPDVAIGIPTSDLNGTDSGTVYLHERGGHPYDFPSWSASLANGTLWGSIETGVAGRRLWAGDLDDDGLDELVVSSFGADHAGTVYLFLGPLEGRSTNVVNADITVANDHGLEEAGHNLTSPGDLDGDGVREFLIGVPWKADNAGAAATFSGLPPDGATVSDAPGAFVGYDFDLIGLSRMDSVGDLTGDGRDDVLLAGGVGAYLWSGLPTVTTPESTVATLARDTCPDAEPIATDDLDADGAGDVWLTCNEEILAFLGPLTGAYGSADAAISLLGRNQGEIDADGALVGDIDGDGSADLALPHRIETTLDLWFGPW